nr:hypothetical protein [Acidimicrobiia bacterium]
GQHGTTDDHLLGPGEFGGVDLIGSLEISDVEEGLISDVAVFGNYAYLGRYDSASCEGPESGGPDGGVYVIDISDVANPVEVGFIRAHQDTYVSEGVQVVRVDTPTFTGDVLVMNQEGCGKNYKAGVTLWDVTDPTKPKKLAQNFGDFTVDGQRNTPHDANQTHSAFLWDVGDRAYLVSVDDEEASDVDIFDVTDPKRPRLIGEYDLAALFPQILQTDSTLGLNEVFLHDMVVKKIGGQFYMLLSYWDAGYVVLNVTDPANPTYVTDSDFTNPDPEALESAGIVVPPEGNAHQAEFTLDNQYIIGTDEDFDPYAAGVTRESGQVIPASPGSDTPTVPQEGITGETVFVGRACPGDAAVPPGGSGTQIAVVERGVCTFTEKVAAVETAGGYEAIIIINREGSDACTAGFGMSAEGGVPTVSLPRDIGFSLFDAPYDDAACLAATPGAGLAPIDVGAVGETVTLSSYFDGWGYVHLFDANLNELDTYAVPEAHDPACAEGCGDLSVHEVATSEVDPSIAYLSYYSAGFRVIQIQNGELVEVGGYLDPAGNNIWGVQVFESGGKEYVAASDRDFGLYIFEYTPVNATP